MRSDGPENIRGKAYSGTTLQKTHTFLAALFKKALSYEYISKNPLDQVERPKRDTKEKKPLTPEEARDLFAAISHETLTSNAIGVALCLCCGLRLSEMLALKWTDYEHNAINITKSLKREKQAFKSTKNEDTRVVPCLSPLADLLEKWMAQQQEWYVSQDLEWTKDAPIVQSRVGNHVLQRTYDRWFKKARQHYPIPNDTVIHDLRHTFVTLLYRDCGIDKRTVRLLSGHKSDQAFGIYTHTTEEWGQKAIIALGCIIAPDSNTACCKNCKLWSTSPHDQTRGCCWADERILTITRADQGCPTKSFTFSFQNLAS